MPEEPSEDEIFAELEAQFQEAKCIMVMQTDDDLPAVKWDPALTEAEVVVNLLKALLLMVLDDFLSEIFDPPQS